MHAVHDTGDSRLGNAAHHVRQEAGPGEASVLPVPRCRIVGQSCMQRMHLLPPLNTLTDRARFCRPSRPVIASSIPQKTDSGHSAKLYNRQEQAIDGRSSPFWATGAGSQRRPDQVSLPSWPGLAWSAAHQVKRTERTSIFVRIRGQLRAAVHGVTRRDGLYGLCHWVAAIIVTVAQLLTVSALRFFASHH